MSFSHQRLCTEPLLVTLVTVTRTEPLLVSWLIVTSQSRKHSCDPKLGGVYAFLLKNAVFPREHNKFYNIKKYLSIENGEIYLYNCWQIILL